MHTANKIYYHRPNFTIEAFYVVMKIDLNFKGHYLIIDNADSHKNGTFLSLKNVFFNNMVSKFQHILYFWQNVSCYRFWQNWIESNTAKIF